MARYDDVPSAGDEQTLDVGRLWSGGFATAVVAALVALVGVLLARGVFDVPVLAPKGEGVWGDADTARYALFAAVAALVATGLMQALLAWTPGAGQFFGWIVGLATLAAAVAPFAADGEVSAQIATGCINAAVGIAVLVLVDGVARRALVDDLTFGS